MALYERATPDLIVQMLRAFAHLLRSITDIKEMNGRRLTVQQMFAPERLADLHEKLSPEIYGGFIAALFKPPYRSPLKIRCRFPQMTTGRFLNIKIMKK